MGTVKCIGILTSGGDAPGMNAAIRAVTRAAIYNGLQVKGIYRGYKGLVTGEIKEFKSQNVSNIIQLGGTILKTARCKEFTTPEGRQLAYDNMKREGIDALVIIGGDGSLTGARIFAQEFDVPCIGLPGTIDNDLYGTDTTIGYDTALNTILDAVDKIRDTATSHERLFFVEVMGRDAGFLALNGAIASGAEAAIIPEFSTEVDQLEEFIKNGFRKSKNSSIVLVAESELTGGAMHYAERVKNEYPQYDVRVTILGHLQRGGSPTAHDRILASRLGAAAIDAIMEDQRNVMIGIEHDEIVYVPFSKAIKNDKPIKRDLVNVLKRKSKNSSIVLVAESELTGGAMHYAERVKNEYPQYDVRVTILGHLQRGGSPTAHDRILASRLGAAAIDAIMEDQRNVMIGIEHDEIVYVPFSKAIKNDKPIKRDLVNVLKELSI